MTTTHTAGLAIRATGAGDADRIIDLSEVVFHLRRGRADERERMRRKLERADGIGAFDGDRLVGFLANLPLTLSIPGGDLRCAGVSFVMVLPTHRRRGLLRALMRELSTLAGSREQPLSALWAAEGAIYGRFGYGVATHGMEVELDAGRPLALRVPAAKRSLRLLDTEQTLELVAPFYERRRSERAGAVQRDERWWRDLILSDAEEDDDELGGPRVVALEGDGDLAGYAIYRTAGGSDHGSARVDLHELDARTPADEAALWRYLGSIDLIDTVKAAARPLDDALPLMAADADQVKRTAIDDALWLRLLDLPAALRARSWATEVELVLGVRDELLPANAGAWRLRAGPDAPTQVERTRVRPDLELDVRDLAAAYLGGTTLAALAGAGLMRERTPAALTALDAALRTPRLPLATDEF